MAIAEALPILLSVQWVDLSRVHLRNLTLYALEARGAVLPDFFRLPAVFGKPFQLLPATGVGPQIALRGCRLHNTIASRPMRPCGHCMYVKYM